MGKTDVLFKHSNAFANMTGGIETACDEFYRTRESGNEENSEYSTCYGVEIYI